MRAFDRDLIRGGHYGQRSCEPHPKAEHMAAPTNAANVKKALANSEPSTHGPTRTSRHVRFFAASGAKADISRECERSRLMSTRPNLHRGGRTPVYARAYFRTISAYVSAALMLVA